MTGNFTSSVPSIDKALSANETHGSFRRSFFAMVNNTTTSATSTSGYVTAQRFDIRPMMPVIGTGLQGFICANISAFTQQSLVTVVAGIEYLLGSLNLSTNVFTPGVSMPQKLIKGGVASAGAKVQTSSGLTFAVIRNALTATNPTITFNYLNSDGNSFNTTLTLPSNSAANSAFFINNSISTNSGIVSILNMSKNTGTSGIIDVYGILPLHFSNRNVAIMKLIY